METAFTPLASLLGGAVIGLAAVVLLFTTGRIAGVSGLASALLPPFGPLRSLAVPAGFVAGLILAPAVFGLATGALPTQTVSGDLLLMAAAGLAVGFGSVTGNGCTSGHGVCGLSRLSARSIVATATFMATAFATVTLVRHGF